MRLNCSHYIIYDFPSSNERNMIYRELNVTKDHTLKQQNNHTHSSMLTSLWKQSKETFMEIYK